MKSLPIYIGARYIWTKQRTQSLAFLSKVSMVGLVVGVSLLILVLSVMNGFDRELRQSILRLVPQASIHHYYGIENWQELVQRALKHREVKAASPFIQVNGLVSLRGQTSSTLIYGFDPDLEANVSRVDEFITEIPKARLKKGDAVILLGKDLAAHLAVQVGDNVMVIVPDIDSSAKAPKVRYLEVAQIIETRTELDSALALTSLTQAENLSGRHRVTGVRLRLDDLFEAPNVVYDLVNELGPGYYGNNWTRTHWNLYQAIQMSKSMVALLMSLIVAIAAFNVVSTLVLVVSDKQGDIAILRTMGASTGQIMRIFVVQGCGIGIAGTIGGVCLGVGLTFVLEPFVQLIESIFDVQFLKSDVYPLTYLPSELRLGDILNIASTAFFMSVLATIYPALKASRIRPAEALRYE